MDGRPILRLAQNGQDAQSAELWPDRRMVRAELLGQHTHETASGNHVHVYLRAGRYIARGRYQGSVFGETLGADPCQASSRLRRLLSEIEDACYLRPTQASQRPLSVGAVPRLDLQRLCDAYLAEVRKLRGKKTAGTYLARLAPVLRFADTANARRRWPLAMDLDRDYAVALRASLFETLVTANGRAGGHSRTMSPRQVYNILSTLRGVFAWALRPDVRKLPAEFASPLTPDIVGDKPSKDPLRAVKLPLELRIRMVEAMDAWQICHLAPSLVLPMRPDEATGLLVTDVDFEKRRLRFGTRFGGRDFTKGRRSFEVPFPPELVPILRVCIAERGAGPLLRSRAVFEGRDYARLRVEKPDDVEAAFEAELAIVARGAVVTEQDAKALFRRVLRRIGGTSPDQLSHEFGGLIRTVGLAPGLRFYDTRSAVTTEMNRAGVPELELRYLTGHVLGDVLNAYVTLDPDGAMSSYFERIRPLLVAIAERAAVLFEPK